MKTVRINLRRFDAILRPSTPLPYPVEARVFEPGADVHCKACGTSYLPFGSDAGCPRCGAAAPDGAEDPGRQPHVHAYLRTVLRARRAVSEREK